MFRDSVQVPAEGREHAPNRPPFRPKFFCEVCAATTRHLDSKYIGWLAAARFSAVYSWMIQGRIHWKALADGRRFVCLASLGGVIATSQSSRQAAERICDQSRSCPADRTVGAHSTHREAQQEASLVPTTFCTKCTRTTQHLNTAAVQHLLGVSRSTVYLWMRDRGCTGQRPLTGFGLSASSH